MLSRFIFLIGSFIERLSYRMGSRAFDFVEEKFAKKTTHTRKTVSNEALLVRGRPESEESFVLSKKKNAQTEADFTDIGFNKKKTADAYKEYGFTNKSDVSPINPIVRASIPLLLQYLRLQEANILHASASREQLVGRIIEFIRQLESLNLDKKMIRDASYVLCTFLDERCNEAATRVEESNWTGLESLLIEFHRDTWGGEDAFTDLQYWLEHASESIDILAFYSLILSLGWRGRYKIEANGEIYLERLRGTLSNIIVSQKKNRRIAFEIQQSADASDKRVNIKKLFLLLALLGLIYLLYDRNLSQSATTLSSKIDTLEESTVMMSNYEMAVIPQQLKEVLEEPWLTFTTKAGGIYVVKFYTDNAFASGSEIFGEKFSKKFNALANALTYWDGSIKVEGHTDSVPSTSNRFPSNLLLSEARARYVAEKINQAITVHRLNDGKAGVVDVSYIGVANNSPVYHGEDSSLYFLNRRVEIVLYSKSYDK